MKTKTLLLISLLSALVFTGCQNNDLSAENQSLKQQITELQQQITQLEQQNMVSPGKTDTPNTEDTSNTASVSANTANNTNELSTSVYTIEELSGMVDEFVASVGSVTPDVNNSSNLDQFFSLKRQGDQIEHALENHENDLESQYRAGTITRDDYRKLDREIEKLEDLIDSACDRLEITFGIDD